ncbi:BofC C-terminal domain-containing protein [Paenibacillus solisilvae]|uniref:BofC C-terminal domain-containing protein n=1 Tax=Paenibacillus solisilvae TaxID=2486751 RepID=A0ABW0VW66_9BACL
MMEFSLWKQLKKKLRRSRRPVWQLGCWFGAAIALFALFAPARAMAQSGERNMVLLDEEPSVQAQSVIRTLEEHEGLLTVKLHRIYICGEEQTVLGQMAAADVLHLLQQHPEWMAVQEKSGAIVMQQQIDDMSESCKRNAFIGLDKHGNLSLFDGAPKKEKVLKTFFQLDVRYMESNLPKEQVEDLMNGIRITDKDAYNSVLSTFSDYAMEKSEKVMKRTY